MGVDVLTETVIDRPIAAVAEFAGHPNNVPAWYVNIQSVEWITAPKTTYTWQAVGENRTRMTLRNRGEPSGFSKLTSPFMAMAMRRANRKDLALLKSVLESDAIGSTGS